jgi:NAD+ synthase (glutamine-hydrolysing)
VRIIHTAVGSVNQIVLDWTGNRERILRVIKAAQDVNVDILCLPELAVTGYGAEDLFLAPFFLKRAWEELHLISKEVSDTLVCLGVPVFFSGKVINCAAFLHQGKIVAIVPKQFLANDGIHYETRWFTPWPKRKILEYRGIPLGDLVLDWGGVRIGVEICEDSWMANRPSGGFPSRGVDLVCHLNASHFSIGKHPTRLVYMKDISRSAGVAVLAANLLGNETGRIIFDGDGTIIANGDVLVESDRLYLGEWSLTSAFVDVDNLRRSRMQKAGITFDIQDEQLITLSATSPKGLGRTVQTNPKEEWDKGSDISVTYSEVTRAVTLGLNDYLRKSLTQGVVVSLSGGVDSSITVACAVLTLARLYLHSEASKNFLSDVDLATTIRNRIVAVYQSTRQSSQPTENFARLFAQDVGVTFYKWCLDPIIDEYENLLFGVTGIKPSWESHDLLKQNIQSRARSPGSWLLSNLNKSLLLTTGNRSEATVGYATMDGDTSGGLNVIGGLSKTFIRGWATWLSANNNWGVNLSSLAKIAQQAPTAELRPAQYNQTDEGDLMSYDLLNRIEKCLVYEGKSPTETYAVLKDDFLIENRENLIKNISLIYRKWATNQWKRERLAPCFHLDDYNVDPRSWCRFPILSAAYEEEIAQIESI